MGAKDKEAPASPSCGWYVNEWYNGQIPQSVLKGRTPIDALKDWQRQRPELFRKRVYNQVGCDT